MSSGGRQPQISILDARLAEIDRRLSTIQSGLGREPSEEGPATARGTTTMRPPPRRPDPPAVLEPSPPPTGDQTDTLDRLQELTRVQETILASMRELLSVLERLAIPAATSAAARAATDGPVSISAGPFVNTQALRAFERGLQSLPGVRSVEVREFEGGDRAILDVHLS